MFLLAALGVAHAADDFGVTLSLAGGWYFTDPLENLDQTWSGVPRLGYNLTRNVIVEAESGYHQGKTRAFGNRYDMLTPRLNLLVVATPEFPVHPFVAVGKVAQSETAARLHRGGEGPRTECCDQQRQHARVRCRLSARLCGGSTRAVHNSA